MTFGEICNYFLYALSGFFFGIFASRYSILAAIKIGARLIPASCPYRRSLLYFPCVVHHKNSGWRLLLLRRTGLLL